MTDDELLQVANVINNTVGEEIGRLDQRVGQVESLLGSMVSTDQYNELVVAIEARFQGLEATVTQVATLVEGGDLDRAFVAWMAHRMGLEVHYPAETMSHHPSQWQPGAVEGETSAAPEVDVAMNEDE